MGPELSLGDGPGCGVVAEMNFLKDTVNSFRIFMEPIIAQFMRDPQKEQKAAGHSNGKPDNVDGCVTRIFENIAQGDFNVINIHFSLHSV
jgi:hypothetical protein